MSGDAGGPGGADGAVGNLSVPFEVDPVWRTKLLNGWDDIDLTDSYASAIASFVVADGDRRRVDGAAPPAIKHAGCRSALP